MKKLSILLSIFFIGCQFTTEDNSIHYIQKNDLDTLVAPQDNFYMYANGGWLKREEML